MGPPPSGKKRKVADGMRGKAGRPAKKFKKQQYYDSDSDEEKSHATGVNQVEQSLVRRTKKTHISQGKEEENGEKRQKSANGKRPAPASSDQEEEKNDDQKEANEDNIHASDDGEDSDVTNGSSSGSNSSDDGEASTSRSKKRKRNDPEAFATSISKILSTKLTTTKRDDPVLSRSKTAVEASKELLDARLSAKASSLLRAQKKAELDRGRVKDVLGSEGPDVGRTLEREKRLKKTAQRGVVKLFNAVRAAQVKGEEAARDARQGVVGRKGREERAMEMSKKGFLELIAGGGPKKTAGMEEG